MGNQAEGVSELEDESIEVGDGEADDDEDYVDDDDVDVDNDDDEMGTGEEDAEAGQQVAGDGWSGEAEGRQAVSTSMSNRSESKPYSSVTHECGVRSTVAVWR